LGFLGSNQLIKDIILSRSEMNVSLMKSLECCMSRTILTAIHVIFSTAAIFLLAQSQTSAAEKNSVSMTGVNISGAEFSRKHIPGIFGRDYTYPKPSSIDYYATKGMNIIRLPVLWERLQHSLGIKLAEPEMRRIDAVVSYATSKGMKIIIDVHNYAAYADSAIGTSKTPISALGQLWRQIATRYKDNDLVIFGLMNEPTGLPTETWLAAANIAIAYIRQTGARNLVLVPGNGWSSARDWTSARYGTPNSQVMLNIVDPSNNFAFDVHQYFDRDFTGTHDHCQSDDIGVTSLTPFTKWAREHHKRGFLGEFGAGSNRTCLNALDRVLKFMTTNNDVWLGWAYWAAGSWWPKDYFTNIGPLDGQDRPQMSVLERYINKK
jgi:endoglucanase